MSRASNTDRDELEEGLLKSLRRYARRERRITRVAKQLVRDSWGDAFNALAGLLNLVRVLGEKVVEVEYQQAKAANDPVFYVLMYLHANACLIASEVLCLLKSGHAGGGLARWRSLHEVSVYAAFIRKHGGKTAERYVRHMHIKDSEDVPSVDRLLKTIGSEGFSPSEKEKVAELRSRLLKRYGDDFHGGFGWAKEACGKKGRVSFSDISSDVGLDSSFEMFYREASHLVHPTWKGILDNPGNPVDDPVGKALLAGPSEHGLWMPAMLTTRSLYSATLSFISCVASEKWTADLTSLSECVDLVSDCLRAVRNQAENGPDDRCT